MKIIKPGTEYEIEDTTVDVQFDITSSTNTEVFAADHDGELHLVQVVGPGKRKVRFRINNAAFIMFDPGQGKVAGRLQMTRVDKFEPVDDRPIPTRAVRSNLLGRIRQSVMHGTPERFEQLPTHEIDDDEEALFEEDHLSVEREPSTLSSDADEAKPDATSTLSSSSTSASDKDVGATAHTSSDPS